MTDITLKRIPEWKKEDRGWVLHKVSAELNGKEVGYLKIAYIPKDVYYSKIKNNIDFMRVYRGWCCGHEPENPRWYILQKAAWYAWTDNNLNEMFEHMDKSQLDAIEKKLNSFIWERYKESIKKFKRFQIDNPYVDYSYVREGFRRQGIGTCLYFEATNWMKELGLTLRASDCQSRDAKVLWEYFDRMGWVKKIKSRPSLKDGISWKLKQLQGIAAL